jgi:hypothetical protein
VGVVTLVRWISLEEVMSLMEWISIVEAAILDGGYGVKKF